MTPIENVFYSIVSCMPEESFGVWLGGLLNERGWSIRELGRRSGLSPGAISNAMTGSRNPGPELCEGIALALKIPPEDVFRKAGLLPSIPQQSDRQELESYLNMLSPEDINTILRLARSLASENKKTVSK